MEDCFCERALRVFVGGALCGNDKFKDRVKFAINKPYMKN